MTSQVKISEIIIPKYYPVFNDRKIRHIILTSGRAGTKSSFAAIRANYQIVSDSHGSVVVLRKHHNNRPDEYSQERFPYYTFSDGDSV